MCEAVGLARPHRTPRALVWRLARPWSHGPSAGGRGGAAVPNPRTKNVGSAHRRGAVAATSSPSSARLARRRPSAGLSARRTLPAQILALCALDVCPQYGALMLMATGPAWCRAAEGPERRRTGRGYRRCVMPMPRPLAARPASIPCHRSKAPGLALALPAR